MKLGKANGKMVRIILTDGSAYEGRAYDYTSALDNDPEPASITIGSIEFFENEIESITEI